MAGSIISEGIDVIDSGLRTFQKRSKQAGAAIREAFTGKKLKAPQNVQKKSKLKKKKVEPDLPTLGGV